MSKLLQTYRQIKVKYPNAILWFRVDDSYQAYEDDARQTANVLHTEVVLGGTTPRKGHMVEVYDVTGFPAPLLDTNLHAMIAHGHTVALVDPL